MGSTLRHPVPGVVTHRWPRPADTFRPDIEGLRAVAVLLVVASHALGAPTGGYVGVDVFFVVSGFLITGLLLREHAHRGRISLRDFYARRVRRLLPAAVLVLAVTNLAAYLLFAGERAGQAVRDSLWSLGFLANVRFTTIGTDYFDDTRPPSPVQHYWSLAVEEQFYVVWPLLLLAALWLAGRRGAGAVLVLATAASFAWSVHLTAADATVAYFATPARAWELGVGALLALGAQSGVVQRLPLRFAVGLGWLGLYGIVLSAVLFTERTPFPGLAAVLPVLSTALVLQAGEAGAADRNRVLVNPVSRYLGRLSYSLYLWHWPVLVIGVAVLPASLGVVVPLVATFILAALCHHLVEEPVRRSSWLARRPAPRSLPKGSGRRAAVALSATAALLGGGFVLPAVALHRDAPMPQAAPPAPADPDGSSADPDALAERIRGSLAPASWPLLDPSLERISLAGAPEWVTDRCDNVNSGNLERCRYGPVTASRTAALVGDSMAISWLPALRDALEPLGFRIHVLTRNQCPAPAVMFYRNRPEEPFTECAEHKDWVVEQVRTLQPELVVVANSLTLVDKQVDEPAGEARYERWGDGMAVTLRTLSAEADRVVLLGAPPRSGNLQECVTRLSDPVDCTEPVPAQWRAVSAAEQQAAHRVGATYVDPEPWFCVDGRCPAVVGRTPVYTDGRHLTHAYARRLAPLIASALKVTEQR
ncbi:MAG: acyltransferase family protein [Mycobacteriales bacterium]